MRTIRQNPFRMISVFQRANKYKTYSCLPVWGSWSRIKIPRKRMKDKDAKVIASSNSQPWQFQGA